MMPQGRGPIYTYFTIYAININGVDQAKVVDVDRNLGVIDATAGLDHLIVGVPNAPPGLTGGACRMGG